MMASAILPSTRLPMLSWAWQATRSSSSPLFGLAMDSKRSAMVSGETRLFSTLRDLRLPFWSRAEHRVWMAKSLIWINEKY